MRRPRNLDSENDEVVFTYHISRYLCENVRFDRRNFIQYLIDNHVDAYPDKERALDEEMHEYNDMIRFCLSKLVELELVDQNGVVQSPTYSSSALLRTLCPTIQRYQMLSVSRLVDSLHTTEIQIRSDPDYRSIINFLNLIHEQNQLTLNNVRLDRRTANMLAQLAVIDISLSNNITLTNLGQIVRLRILATENHPT
jgi:hypothetical protein